MDEYEGPTVTIDQIVVCESCGIIDMALGDEVLAVAMAHRRWHQEEAAVVPRTTVHFVGGPWDGQTYDTKQVTAPVFAVGHEVGNHYWLDTKSGNTPTYHWDGTEWEMRPETTAETLLDVLGIEPGQRMSEGGLDEGADRGH